MQPVGTVAYELADGTTREYPFGLVEIQFMGEVMAGRVVFGPDDVELMLAPRLLNPLELQWIQQAGPPKRLPAIPLKRMRRRPR